MRDRILKQPKGDRAFVELLMMTGEAGLDALTVACELTLECGAVSAAVVMNELRRLIAPQLSGFNFFAFTHSTQTGQISFPK